VSAPYAAPIVIHFGGHEHRARVNFLCFLKASANDIFRVQKLGASTDATTI
jgi:hypothetical protein